MFWNNLSPQINTVKFKIALLCAVLFLFSAILCALIVYGGKYEAISRRIDPGLKADLQRAEFEYLTGIPWSSDFRRQKLPREDSAVFKELQKIIPGLIPLLAFQTDNVASFTVVGNVEQRLYMLRRQKGGSFSVEKKNPKNHLDLLQKSFDQQLSATGYDLFRARILDKDDKVIIVSRLPIGVEYNEDLYRNFRTKQISLYDGNVIEIGYNRTPYQNQFGYYYERLVLILFLLPGLGFFTGWVVADRLLAGVKKVTEAAKKIAGGDYSQRVPDTHSGSEIDEMVSTFNMMNAKTKELFTQIKRVTDDVAHDLRTPITRIRCRVEMATQDPDCSASSVEAFGDVAEECDAIIAMINSMLEIARAESGLPYESSTQFDLRDLLVNASELFQSSAEEAQIQWKTDIPESPAPFNGDKLKIQRMVANLLDNAIKFLKPNQCFTLALQNEPNCYKILAIDTGPGIPDEYKQKIFNRFFRLDSSRSMRGNGLGLALVQAIAMRHNGSIMVTDTPGGGATFTVRLPK